MSKQRTPNGTKGNMDFGIRVGVVVRRNDDILLVRHEKPGREPYWVLPGGRLKPGETIPECAVRELMEETGLEVEFARVLFVSEFMRQKRHTVDVTVEASASEDSEAVLGYDPETPEGDTPTLQELAWVSSDALNDINLLPAWVVEKLAGTDSSDSSGLQEVYQGVSRDDQSG